MFRCLETIVGSGELTLEVARAVGSTGRVLGLDASADMVSKATDLRSSNSSELPAPVAFLVQDGHDLPLPDQKGAFDKVFSSAALHWMKQDPSLVLSNIFTMLRPGGSLAAEFGGFMNCVGVRGQLHASLRQRGIRPESYDPWFFPTADGYKTMLEKTGFKVKSFELVPRPTPLPKESGLKGWLSTFAGPFLNAIQSEEERAKVVQEVEDALRPDCYDVSTGVWSVMYVRLRVLAQKLE